MGMSASQARLLSITARISDTELTQQSIAYSKQRLSESSEMVNDVYLDALAKTKYQVLTGFNNSEATYADLTYNAITGPSAVAAGKQYLVKNNEGKVLVPYNVAKAYKDNNGDFNRFLRDLGYTQSNIDVKQIEASEEAIHEAWDKYFASVGKGIDSKDTRHILGFDYTSFSNDSYDGYVTYNTAYSTNNNGKEESLKKDSNGYYRERYLLEAREYEDEATGEKKVAVGYQTEDQKGTDEYTVVDGVEYNAETGKFIYTNQNNQKVEVEALYADPNEDLISENYKNYLSFTGGNSYVSEGGTAYIVTKESKALNFEGTTQAQRELFDYATAITEAYYNNKNSRTSENLKYDAEMVTYYQNIFNEMRKTGLATIENETNFKDSEWFVKQLKAGNITLSYYSISEKEFIGTTIDNDGSIVEKEDTAAMVVAEQIYKSQMDKIESQDKQLDLQMGKMESQHSALTAEYDAVKKVISNNISKSFNTFSA